MPRVIRIVVFFGIIDVFIQLCSVNLFDEFPGKQSPLIKIPFQTINPLRLLSVAISSSRLQTSSISPSSPGLFLFPPLFATED